MITILHNPRCSKSRCALDYTQMFPKLEIQVRNYLKEPLNQNELTDLCANLNQPIEDLVRTSDKAYIELHGKEKLNDEAFIDLLASHPELLQRPILIDGNTVIIGRPPELVLEYLQTKK